jgi:hypothetical protein
MYGEYSHQLKSCYCNNADEGYFIHVTTIWHKDFHKAFSWLWIVFSKAIPDFLSMSWPHQDWSYIFNRIA